MVIAALVVLLSAVPDTVRAPGQVVVEPPVPVTSMAESMPVIREPASAVGVPAPAHRFDRSRATTRVLLPVETPARLSGAGSVVVGSIGPVADPDSTDQQRPVIVDYSDAYYTRLTIHKWASWAMLPLFGLAYYTGQDLYNKGLDTPDWERRIHGPVAASLAGLFALNTITGGWNLWEGRKDPNGRAWRTTHGVLMLLADAGFAAVGMTAPEHEEASGVFNPGSSLGESGGNAGLHRSLAVGSMAVAVVSWVMMLPPFRRD